MQSSFTGNLTGTVFFLYFMLAGTTAACLIFKKENSFAKLIMGLAAGALFLHCLPSLFAFVFGFTVTAHILAAVTLVPVYICGIKKSAFSYFDGSEIISAVKQNKLTAAVFTLTFALWCYLLYTHILLPTDGNGLYTGQCTYGDMCMHLGFISSIANQSVFPPDYSIFPGTLLAYPFLNAAISSSIYLFGASLRWAYILPMLTAFIQIIGCVYLLAYTVLGSRGKSFITYIMYIFNGGLGFIYFTGLCKDSGLKFRDIFSGYYTTPTNLIDHNIRWANLIADIFLPQRASLFGYAMLFPCIWLLYRAVWQNEKKYFIYAGISAASLPLIHTHSFLGIGLISASWLLLYLYRNSRTNAQDKWYGLPAFTVFVFTMCGIQLYSGVAQPSSVFFMAVGVSGLGVCVLYGILLLYRYIKLHGYKELLNGWGIYLLIVLFFSIPQLVIWTFGQVSEGGFLRGHFNWGNLGSFYPWFYLKNIGIPLIVIVGAVVKGCKKSSHLVLPAAVIWFVAEFIMFTPNTYDNNKLLYIAYFLLCICGADFAGDVYSKIRCVPLKKAVLVSFVFLSTFSALLTLGREAVSEYQIFSQPHLEAAEFIENNVDADAVILTNTRHNNEVAALTGRNIVCGSDIYLYFHGINTSQRKTDVAAMYEYPAQSSALFESYDVSYAMVSSWERGEYAVDESYFAANFEKVFSSGNVDLYKVK